MNKVELVNEYHRVCKLLAIPAQYVVLGAGGALMMLGLREQTRDLDLGVPTEVFDACCRASPEQVVRKCPDMVIFPLTSLADLHPNTAHFPIQETEGVWHYTAEAVLEQKRTLNREKDQQDILNLEAYLCLL